MPDLRDDLNALKSAIERHCIARLDAPVQLASGGWSTYYFDGKGVTLHPRYARIIGRLMAPGVIESGAEAVGGMAVGSIPISDAVGQGALELGKELPTFFARAAAKDHGPSAKASMSAAVCEDDPPLLRAGRRVAIVEDAVTTGGSSLKSIDAAIAEGCEVVLMMCVVERHEGGGARFRERGIPFKRLFYTREDGSLHVDEEILARTRSASTSRP